MVSIITTFDALLESDPLGAAAGLRIQLTPLALSRAVAGPQNVLHEDDQSILVAGSSPISCKLEFMEGTIYVKEKAEKSWRFLRQGFGWKRWSRRWMYGTVGLFTDYRVRYLVASPKDAPARYVI